MSDKTEVEIAWKKYCDEVNGGQPEYMHTELDRADFEAGYNACAEKAVDRDRLKECELALREFLIDSEWSLELTTERERMVIEYFKKYGELK